MDDYKPNSHRFREERTSETIDEKKKVEKVVTGMVKTKKKSDIHKIASIFISDDIKDVKSYILMDVVVPTVKKTIISVIDMILNGGSARGGSYSNASKVSYRNYYDRRDDDRRPSDGSRTRTGYSYDDIILETRGEAEDVLSRMDELIDTYGVVSVADLYDLIGKTCNYTDNKYGWTNLRNAEPIRVRDGYMLKLPKVAPIN